MRFYANKIPDIAAALSKTLLAAGDIESEAPREVEADLTSVLRAYLEAEQRINERAKDAISRGRGQSEYGRLRQHFAEQAGIKIGDDALDYVLDQLVEMLHHSHNVDEIYPEDVELRRKLRDVLRRYVADDSTLDTEVRAQLRHVQEGSRVWDIEYARVLEQVKRRRGLS